MRNNFLHRDTHTRIHTYVHELQWVVQQCDTNTWLTARPVTWLLEIWQYNTTQCVSVVESLLCVPSPQQWLSWCVSVTLFAVSVVANFTWILLLILRCMKHPPPVTFPCIAVLISGWWSCWLLYQTTRIATLFSSVGNFF